ncbi:MAG: Histidine triad (HIT) protein [Parcubacteria bacterium C7867-004]|nr:MAG: Histidine triad (HIT) protein [Parcubacteria bacterium C7867-004]
MEDSVFTKIIKRELPAEIIYEDDSVIAILDLFPSVEGAMLVISKLQLPYFANLDDVTYAHLMAIVKRLSKVLDATFSTLRTCVVIEGFEVPHVHVRLYPVQQLPFDMSPGPQASPEELRSVGERVRANL